MNVNFDYIKNIDKTHIFTLQVTLEENEGDNVLEMLVETYLLLRSKLGSEEFIKDLKAQVEKMTKENDEPKDETED